MVYPYIPHIFPSGPPHLPSRRQATQARCRVKQKMADLDRSSVVVYGRSHGIMVNLWLIMVNIWEIMVNLWLIMVNLWEIILKWLQYHGEWN